MSDARRLKRLNDRKKLTIAKSVDTIYDEVTSMLADSLMNIDWDKNDPEDKIDVFNKWNGIYQTECREVLARKKQGNIDSLMRLFKKNFIDHPQVSDFWYKVWNITSRLPLVIPPVGIANLPITIEVDLELNLGA